METSSSDKHNFPIYDVYWGCGNRTFGVIYRSSIRIRFDCFLFDAIFASIRSYYRIDIFFALRNFFSQKIPGKFPRNSIQKMENQKGKKKKKSEKKWKKKKKGDSCEFFFFSFNTFSRHFLRNFLWHFHFSEHPSLFDTFANPRNFLSPEFSFLFRFFPPTWTWRQQH